MGNQTNDSAIGAEPRAAAAGRHPNIENKVAVVTGGSRGIGYCIAEKLLAHGAKVVIGAEQKGDEGT